LWGCDCEGDDVDDNGDWIFDKVLMVMLLIIAMAFDQYVSDSVDDDGPGV
jgi:hypothetical protein